LDEGKVVETGTPAQLLAKEGAYAKMISTHINAVEVA
jgi:ABC-type multidrug transport system fused ATPase/permease subunit